MSETVKRWQRAWVDSRNASRDLIVEVETLAAQVATLREGNAELMRQRDSLKIECAAADFAKRQDNGELMRQRDEAREKCERLRTEVKAGRKEAWQCSVFSAKWREERDKALEDAARSSAKADDYHGQRDEAREEIGDLLKSMDRWRGEHGHEKAQRERCDGLFREAERERDEARAQRDALAEAASDAACSLGSVVNGRMTEYLKTNAPRALKRLRAAIAAAKMKS